MWQRLLQLRRQLPHALLFHGRAGIGKLALAEAYAQWLLCEAAPVRGTSACGQCPSCHWFAQGSHPDFRRLQPAAADTEEPETPAAGRKSASAGQKISVEQVRELVHFAQLSAHRGGLRIALIQPAEDMNAAAANALLKTLEEPSANTLLILISNQPGRLLPTILSRCHQLRFTLPGPAAALAWLNQQAVGNAEACLAQAGGAPLLACQLADDDYQARRRTFLTALARMNGADALRSAEHSAKQPMPELLHWLQQWTHDLLSLRLAGHVSYQVDFEQELRGLAVRVNLVGLMDFQRRLLAARASAQHPLNPQMVLEDLLLEYASLFGQKEQP